MATATDEIYVKIIAETDQAVKGMKQVGDQTEKTASSMHSFKNGVKAGLEPLHDLYRAMHEILALGGLAILFREAARAVGDMQMAFEKANPASAKAIGSLTSWNAVMEDTKAKGGGMIESVLNPMRAVFIGILDPLVEATTALAGFDKEIDVMVQKFGSQQLKDVFALADFLKSQQQAQDQLKDLYQQRLDLAAKLKAYQPADKGKQPSFWENLVLGAAQGAGAMGGAATSVGTDYAAQSDKAFYEMIGNKQREVDAAIAKLEMVLDDFRRNGFKPGGTGAGGTTTTDINDRLSFTGGRGHTTQGYEAGLFSAGQSGNMPPFMGGPPMTGAMTGGGFAGAAGQAAYQLSQNATPAISDYDKAIQKLGDDMGAALQGNIGSFFTALGAAAASGQSAEAAFRSMISGLMGEIGNMMIVAGLKMMITATNEVTAWTGLGIAVAGGLTSFIGGAIGAGGSGSASAMPSMTSTNYSPTKTIAVNTNINLDGETVARSVAIHQAAW